MRVLLTGRDGQVGRELWRALRGLAEVDATDRSELDLADPRALARALHERSPDLILNAAAYTAVERAESDPGPALAVNAEAPRVLAAGAARLDIPIVHYSTDAVFDGDAGAPYAEGDATAPVDVYGRSKLIGERAVTASGAPHLVLRIGWVYGARRRNALTALLEELATSERVLLTDDGLGSPIWARDVAAGTLAALETLGGPWTRMTRAGLASGFRARGGLFHLAPPDHASRSVFAREVHVMALRQRHFAVRARRIEVVSRSAAGRMARPRDTRLSSRRMADRLGIALDPWRDGLAACLEDMAARRSALVSADGDAALLAGR